MEHAYIVEYKEPHRGWVAVAAFDDAHLDDAVAQFTLTCENVSAATVVRLVAPAEGGGTE